MSRPPYKQTRAGRIWTFVSIFLTVGFVYFLFTRINAVEVISSFGKLSLQGITAIFLAFALNYLLRAIRFGQLLKTKVSFGKLLSITILNDTLNNFLPLKSGELYYVLVMRRIPKIGLVGSVASLVLSRIFDLVIVGTVFIVSYLLLDPIKDIEGTAIIIVITVALLLGLMLILVYFSNTVIAVCRYFLGVLRLDKIKFLKKPIDNLLLGLDYFKILRDPKKFAIVTLSSVFMWTSVYYFIYRILAELGFFFEPAKLFILTSGLFLGFILPINTVANIGTYEAILAFFLVIFGISLNIALQVAVSVHLIVLGYVLLFGIIAFMIK